MVKTKVLGKVKDYYLNLYYVIEELHSKDNFAVDRKLYIVRNLKNIGKKAVNQNQRIVDVVSHSLFLNNESVVSLSPEVKENKVILDKIEHYFRAEEDDKLRGLVSECEGEGVGNLFFLHYVSRVRDVRKIHDRKPLFLNPESEDPTGLFVYLVEFNDEEVRRNYAPFILVRQYTEGVELTFISRDLMRFMHAYFNEQMQRNNEKSI